MCKMTSLARAFHTKNQCAHEENYIPVKKLAVEVPCSPETYSEAKKSPVAQFLNNKTFIIQKHRNN